MQVFPCLTALYPHSPYGISNRSELEKLEMRQDPSYAHQLADRTGFFLAGESYSFAHLTRTLCCCLGKMLLHSSLALFLLLSLTQRQQNHSAFVWFGEVAMGTGTTTPIKLEYKVISRAGLTDPGRDRGSKFPMKELQKNTPQGKVQLQSLTCGKASHRISISSSWREVL